MTKAEELVEASAQSMVRGQRGKWTLLAAFHAWMIEQSAKVDQGFAFAAAFNYAFNNRDALQRYAEDGHLEIDNNIAERAVRSAGVGSVTDCRAGIVIEEECT